MTKSDREVTEILAAFDATECMHSAAELAGCDPKTVRRYVEARNAGAPTAGPARRRRLTDTYAEKIEEWVERSEARIRADRVHERLVGMGYTGNVRTTRRAVSEAKARWRDGHRRTCRPWIPEPGLWLQFGWDEGPLVPGPDGSRRRTVLFCAWLPWSRFRRVIPCWDRTLPTLICCLDNTLRALGGAPAYVLAHNEKTVTVDPATGVLARHPGLVAAARHYGSQIHPCTPYDPRAVGGEKAAARISPADLVPTQVNLRGEYGSLAELRSACAELCARANSRIVRETGTSADARLAVERTRLHPLPTAPYVRHLGESRTVDADNTIRRGAVAYPVPPGLAGRQVWVRVADGELVVVADLAAHPLRPAGPAGLAEVARHRMPARPARAAALAAATDTPAGPP